MWRKGVAIAGLLLLYASMVWAGCIGPILGRTGCGGGGCPVSNPLCINVGGYNGTVVCPTGAVLEQGLCYTNCPGSCIPGMTVPPFSLNPFQCCANSTQSGGQCLATCAGGTGNTQGAAGCVQSSEVVPVIGLACCDSSVPTQTPTATPTNGGTATPTQTPTPTATPTIGIQGGIVPILK